MLLAAGHEPSAETALSILAYARERLAPYKRIRRLEFADLPKTISGKIRRVELREAEQGRPGDGPWHHRVLGGGFPGLKAVPQIKRTGRPAIPPTYLLHETGAVHFTWLSSLVARLRDFLAVLS